MSESTPESTDPNSEHLSEGQKPWANQARGLNRRRSYRGRIGSVSEIASGDAGNPPAPQSIPLVPWYICTLKDEDGWENTLREFVEEIASIGEQKGQLAIEVATEKQVQAARHELASQRVSVPVDVRLIITDDADTDSDQSP